MPPIRILRGAPPLLRAVLLAALLAPALASGAAAAEVAVTVTEVEDAEGRVLVAVCTEDTFLSRDCPYYAHVPAEAGATTVIVEDVPPGDYAVQAIHDANDNMDLDRNFIGWPLEGVGFSNDAPIRMGPPSYEDARVEIGAEDAALRLRMRYY